MVGTAFQAIGLGFPSVVGAALAPPEATVVLTTGDGGGLMALSDLESAVRVAGGRGIAVVWNDGAYGAELHLYGRKGLSHEPMLIPRWTSPGWPPRSGPRASSCGRSRISRRSRPGASSPPANAGSSCSTCGSPERSSRRSGRRSRGRAAENARPLLTTGKGAHDRRQHRPQVLRPARTAGQDRRGPPQLRVARRPARPPPDPPVVLLQALELGGSLRGNRRAPARHRAARVRGRDRARHRHGGSARSLEQAWDHVAWVTAANDLGLYDLRANDKGSNVRSKGGDGFTPVGPTLLDARALDPGALRLRTWVNGELRQDDTTAGLLFGLPQLVADLSQHLTLEPGDVILTGTPAGSSVLVPGDVVEVEVDAPGGPTSGRLVTTVVQGDHAFDGALGSLPAADDHQRAEAWGSRAAARARSGGPLPRAAREAPAGSGRRPQRAAAQARPRRGDDRRRPADGPRGQARRDRAHPAVRPRPRGPVRAPRRRLQRPEAPVRHGRRGRGRRDRGAR